MEPDKRRGPRGRSIQQHWPYAWQERKALEKIRHEIGTSTALNVYLALTEAASHVKSHTFEINVSALAGLARLSYSATSRQLAELHRIGLIAKRTNKIPGKKANTANTWTLLGAGIPKSGPLSSEKRTLVHEPCPCNPDKLKGKQVKNLLPVDVERKGSLTPSPSASACAGSGLDCEPKEEEPSESTEPEKIEEMKFTDFEKLCPDKYRDFELGLCDCPEPFQNMVAQWCEIMDRPGLMIVGPPGIGKKRAAYEAMRRLMEEERTGFRIRAVTAFAKFDAHRIDALCDVDALLITDLHELRFTKNIAEDFTELLKSRDEGKPTIITTAESNEELAVRAQGCKPQAMLDALNEFLWVDYTQ